MRLQRIIVYPTTPLTVTHGVLTARREYRRNLRNPPLQVRVLRHDYLRDKFKYTGEKTGLCGMKCVVIAVLPLTIRVRHRSHSNAGSSAVVVQ